MLLIREGEDRQYLSSGIAPKLFSARTDEEGKFIFKNLPAKATADFLINKTGHATINTWTASDSLTYAVGQKDIRVVLPEEAKIEGVVIEKQTGKFVSGVELVVKDDRNRSAQEPFDSKEDGTFSIRSLAQRHYTVELVPSNKGLADWVAEPVEVITETGKTKSGIKIALSKGGLLEVVVTDALNKKPLEQAGVGVSNQAAGRSSYHRSDEKGIARIRLTPGDYQIYQVYKQGYASQRQQDTVTIEDDKTERLEYELTGVPKITGIVRDEKGNAIEGVKVRVCPMGARDNIATDAEGKFEMAYDPGMFGGSRTPITYLVCRDEKRNLAAAMQVDQDTGTLDVKLEPGVTFTGKVADPDGNSIQGATTLVYLRASNWGSPIGRDFPPTEGKGQFKIKAIPAEQKYNLYTRAEGYGELRTEVNMDDVADNRLDVGTITLAIANLSISGVVVDDNDKPVAGARISCYGDGQPHRSAQTDTEGKFTIEKVCAGKMRISASKTGATRLSGSIETEGGATDVRITISQRSSSSRYQPKRPPSLMGRPLPDLKALGIDLSASGKRILVCFWDMQQRPSRHCVMQLARQADTLKNKGVIVVAVQASKADQSALTQWAKKYKIPFPVGMVQRSFEKARFSWGIRSLPWLILTDTRHVISSTGFPIKELNEKLK
ncbi:carboxypeptidase regulatory-like domain-containing protein, partial [Planctomycetota bacterium]